MSTIREIDLGLDRSPPVARRPPGWWQAWLPPLRRAWWRWWRLVVAPALAVGLLAVLAPMPAPPVSPLVVVAQRDQHREEFMILGDVLLITDREPESGWSAHQLPGGDYLWTMLEWPSQPVPDGPILGYGNPYTVARDPVTGDVLWRTTAFVRHVPGTALVLLLEEGFEPEPPDDAEARFGYDSVAVADLATGTARWSAQAEDLWRIAVGSPDGVFTVDGPGAAQVRDLHTGGVVAEGALTAPVNPGSAAAVADTGVAAHWQAGEPFVQGYDLQTLRPRWRRDIPLSGGDSGTSVTEGLFYWQTADEFRVLVDERSGTVRTLPRPRGTRLMPFGERLLVVGGEPDRLRLYAIHAPGTGDHVTAPAGWRLVVPALDDPDHLLLTYDFGRDTGTGLARLDPATGQVSYLGRHPGRLRSCAAFDGGVICRQDGRLALLRWR